MKRLSLRLSDDVAEGVVRFCGDVDHASRVIDLMVRKALVRWGCIRPRRVGKPRKDEAR